MEPGQACAMQCVRLWWHAECSGAQCTHSARKHGGRLRAGPSFLAKVDLLIGRWPGWEGGTHLCSRCSPCCPSSAAISVAHCYLVERRWPASGAQLLRSSTTEVWSLEGQRCWCGFCRALAKVGAGGRVGLRWSLQTSKDEEEGAAAWHPPLLPLLPLTCYKRVKMEKSWAREQQQMEALSGSPARAFNASAQGRHNFGKVFPLPTLPLATYPGPLPPGFTFVIRSAAEFLLTNEMQRSEVGK